MKLCKNTTQIVYEYIHRDIFDNVTDQLCTLTRDLEYASKLFDEHQYITIRCKECKLNWTYFGTIGNDDNDDNGLCRFCYHYLGYHNFEQ